MDTQLQATVSDALKQLMDNAPQAFNSLVDQTRAYGYTNLLMSLILSLIGFVSYKLGVNSLIKMKKLEKDNPYGDTTEKSLGFIVLAIVSFFMVLISIIGILENVSNSVKMISAPALYLLGR